MTTHRKKGSKNKLDKLAKNELIEFLSKPENDLGKLLKSFTPDQKFIQIKHLLKLLSSGNDPLAMEIRSLTYEQMKGDINKFRSYYWHLPEEKKASELRQLIKMLPPDKIADVIRRMGGEK